MKRVLLAAFLILVVAPSAQAAIDEWTTPIANAAGLTTAGTIHVYMQVPEGQFGRVGDTFHSSALMTAPASTSPVVAWTINHAHGCTTANPTTRTTTTGIGVISSFDFDVSTTSTTCSISVRLEYTVGVVPTKIYDQQLTMTLPSGDHSCGSTVLELDSRACGASAFEVETALRGGEFFAILSLAVVCLAIGAWVKQPLARFSSGLLLILLGVLLLYFTQNAIIVILAAVLLLLGALTFLQVSLEWTRTGRGKKQPRRFFE